MKALFSLTWPIVLGLLFACTAEPPAQEALLPTTPEPLPYLYKPPVVAETGLSSSRLKNEELAEAFVSRLSTQAPAGVVVLFQEKLVLEEYFSIDSGAYVCVEALFPAYAGAMVGSTARHTHEVPWQMIPLQELYASQVPASTMLPAGKWTVSATAQDSLGIRKLDRIIENQAGTSHGMAAEEFLFEPLRIDDYTWSGNQLCLHPHAMLKLGSLWVRRGRWQEEQILPVAFVNRVLAPAYDGLATTQNVAYGWQYHRLVAKGRKQPLLYWRGKGAHLILLPELEAVVLLQGNDTVMEEGWGWLQDYLIPSLAF